MGFGRARLRLRTWSRYKSYWAEVLVQLLWEEKQQKRITHSTVQGLLAAATATIATVTTAPARTERDSE